jgi:hypothetical protein
MTSQNSKMRHETPTRESKKSMSPARSLLRVDVGLENGNNSPKKRNAGGIPSAGHMVPLRTNTELNYYFKT